MLLEALSIANIQYEKEEEEEEEEAKGKLNSYFLTKHKCFISRPFATCSFCSIKLPKIA